MNCLHLVHDECLKRARQALNSDGSRYGIGGLDGGETPRAGCPVCSLPISFWFTSKEAAFFPIFWMHRIQDCLEEIGPDDGPIPIARVKRMLKADVSLTRDQKSFIDKKEQICGFQEALNKGRGGCVQEVRDGGPSENGGSIVIRVERHRYLGHG